MHTYISLLRGINVNSKHKLPMTALKRMYQVRGCVDVTTYIQSGNVVFQTKSNIEALEHSLSQAMQEKFGYTVPVLEQEAHFFSKIVTNNPFKDCEPNTLYVTLLGDATRQAQIASIADEVGGEDSIMLQENVVYVHCPNGYRRTKLNNSFFETKGQT